MNLNRSFGYLAASSAILGFVVGFSNVAFRPSAPSAFVSRPVVPGTCFDSALFSEPEVAAVEDVAEEVAEEPAAPAAEEEVAQKPKREFKPSIYVGNISFETTDDEIREVFEEHGTVAAVTLPTNRETGRSRGFAFVVMPDKAEMEAAIAATHEMVLGGRTIFVSESLPKGQTGDKKRPPRAPREPATKIYVGNLDFDTEAETIKEAFESYGEVKDVYIPVDGMGNARGFAFLSMSPDDAQQAIDNMNGTQLDGRRINVNKSLPKGQKSQRAQQTKLYVGNLSWGTEEYALRELFEEYGNVIDCYVPHDRETGQHRGFAFVTMDAEGAGRAADETDGYELDGRILRVNEAQPKGYAPAYSGGGDGYDGGDDAYEEAGGDDSWGNDAY